MPAIDYPTLEEIRLLQAELIDEHGGDHGVRDQGLVESALLRPQTGYYETLLEEAAAMLQSFATNHGFVDGNKRIAFGACSMFLDLNRCKLKVDDVEVERFVKDDVVRGHASVEEIAVWLEEHLV